MSSEVKVCRVCGCVLVSGENWYISFKHNPICKNCDRARVKEYRANNRDAVNSNRRRYLKENPEKRIQFQINSKESNKKWKNNNKDKVRERARIREHELRKIKSECGLSSLPKVPVCRCCNDLLIVDSNWSRSCANHPEYICIRCNNKQKNEYYHSIPKHILQRRRREYYLLNRERLLEWGRIYRIENAEKRRETIQKYYSLNRDRCAISKRNYQSKVKSARIEAYLAYRQERQLLHQLLEITT